MNQSLNNSEFGLNKSMFNKLLKRKEENNYRNIDFIPISKIDFFTNDYLGVSRNWSNYFEKKFDIRGSTGSRLLSGNSKEALECEEKIAFFYKSEAALVFNSGYDANIGLISTIVSRDDLIIYDENIHASLRDGIVLSRAKSISFNHNDTDDLEKKIEKFNNKTIFVIIESIYSMDGEVSPLIKIADLCEQYNAKLIVDEAHSGGIYGNNGEGLCVLNEIQNKVFIRIITFSKAYGFHGAAILSSNNVKQFLINFCRSFIYTTALPPINYKIISYLINIDLTYERKLLFENINIFNILLKTNSLSPIKFIKVKEIKNIDLLNDKLKNVGIFQKVIKYPSVSKENEGIRLCLHSFNNYNEILILKDILDIQSC